ncbi:MAG: efflux RND transporter periplasmic adaptor subunit [Planctomycetia bacterium]|nr:efflux RND transporter periplasmic adaptor subunit [Planctomycetia bacterium]
MAFPTVAPLVLLVSLGYWGHARNWQLVRADKEPPYRAHPRLAAAPAEGEAQFQSPDDAEAEAAAPSPADQAAEPRGTRVALRSAAAVQKAGVQVVRVARRPVDQEIVVNGVIAYDQSLVAHLSTRVPGTVWRIEKKLGQPFEKGDVLAIIEAVDVGRAKADFLQAVVMRQLKREIIQRLRSVEASIPQRQLLDAQAEARETEIRLVNAQQTLQNLGLPVRLEELAGVPDDQLARRIQFLGLPESIAATLDPATTTSSLVPLLAPFDGVVIGHEVSLGEVVSSSHPQFVVADTRQMWIKLDVRKEDAGRLALGQEVTFQADGVLRDITSTITWISTEADEKTRTVPVRAEVANPLVSDRGEHDEQHRLLRANTFGTGRIRVTQQPTAVVVPRESVQWDGSRWVVFVQVSETAFEAQPVEVGVALEDVVQIVKGVSEGETVAARGSHLLKAEIIRDRLVSGAQ